MDWRDAAPVVKRRLRPPQWFDELRKNLGMPVFKRIAEVGVFRGDGAHRWVKAFPRAEIWLVDIWKKLRETGPISVKYGDAMDEIYLDVVSSFRNNRRVRIIRSMSDAAAVVFPDHYFDCVYIDADHETSAVLADIAAWMPKVRPGGLIGGHDYEGRRRHGVKRAVDSVFGEQVLSGTHHTWAHLCE